MREIFGLIFEIAKLLILISILPLYIVLAVLGVPFKGVGKFDTKDPQ